MKTFLYVLTMGFALFSMHFGAGNIIFPISLGVQAEQHCLTAMFGFLVTAVLIPMFGFYVMMQLQGNVYAFFGKWGKLVGLPAIPADLMTPGSVAPSGARSPGANLCHPFWGSGIFGSAGIAVGLLLITCSMCVLGAFGGLPRCIALTHATVHELFPGLVLELFAVMACALIFLATFRENQIVALLGKFLTPVLLVTLSIVLVSGFFSDHHLVFSFENGGEHFVKGILDGPQTLDLIAALFFSQLLYPSLSLAAQTGKLSAKQLSFWVAAVAGFLLSVTYVGFGYLGALYSEALQGVPEELTLIRLAEYLLGSFGAQVTMVLVSIACLTTAIALAALFAKFLQHDLLRKRVRYEVCLAATLLVSYFVATLSFKGIAIMLCPVLEVSYPVLIALCLLNSFSSEKKLSHAVS